MNKFMLLVHVLTVSGRSVIEASAGPLTERRLAQVGWLVPTITRGQN